LLLTAVSVVDGAGVVAVGAVVGVAEEVSVVVVVVAVVVVVVVATGVGVGAAAGTGAGAFFALTCIKTSRIAKIIINHKCKFVCEYCS
jgi:hypothetical protein